MPFPVGESLQNQFQLVPSHSAETTASPFRHGTLVASGNESFLPLSKREAPAKSREPPHVNAGPGQGGQVADREETAAVPDAVRRLANFFDVSEACLFAGIEDDERGRVITQVRRVFGETAANILRGIARMQSSPHRARRARRAS